MHQNMIEEYTVDYIMNTIWKHEAENIYPRRNCQMTHELDVNVCFPRWCLYSDNVYSWLEWPAGDVSWVWQMKW